MPTKLGFINSLLRFTYNLLYQPFAWSYDWVAAFVSCGQWQDWVKSALPYLPGPRVLELGHGPGHLQITLKQNGIQTIGLDISRQMGSLAKRNLRRAGYHSDLINSYAQSVSFPLESFDQVVATFPAEYIFNPQTLAEVHRVLKPDGRLVVLLGGWLTGRRVCHRLLGWLLHGPSESEFAREQYWQDAFINAGFSVSSQLIDLPESRLLLLLATRNQEKAHPTS